VEGLLDLSRPTKIHREEVDLFALSSEVADRLVEAGEIERSRLLLQGAPLLLPGDEQRLRQVVLNLLRNAIEAAGPEGFITLRVAGSSEQATLEVQDEGPGIDPETRARLFEPFYTTKPKGTGLGLAVSRVWVEAHGGQIEVIDPPRGGACFRV